MHRSKLFRLPQALWLLVTTQLLKQLVSLLQVIESESVCLVLVWPNSKWQKNNCQIKFHRLQY